MGKAPGEGGLKLITHFPPSDAEIKNDSELRDDSRRVGLWGRKYCATPLYDGHIFST